LSEADGRCELDFARDGAKIFRQALNAQDTSRIRALSTDGVGTRLLGDDLEDAIRPVTEIAARLAGSTAKPVRAVLFDKTAEKNWHLGWHQDRTIAVKARVEIEGFDPWTTKQGILHVAPPMDVLKRMVTVRIHLDPCDEGNAPLKIALGSHKLGRVAAEDASAHAAKHPVFVCLAEAGDVWAYATPILHASDRAAKPARRRVLQVDYAAFDLPQGLEWLGVKGCLS
jgi:hypothetical protein